MRPIEKNKRYGFSLVEILIVMAIAAIVIWAVISSNFSGSRNKNLLVLTTSSVKSETESVAVRSRAQEGGFQWWIRFENPTGAGNDYYTICYGTYSGTPGASCSAEGGTESTRTYLGQDVNFSDPADGTSKNAVFAKATGLPISTKKVTLSIGSFQQVVVIRSNGAVDSGDYWKFGYAGYWKLDDGTGTTTIDSSTNANTGTLTNGPTWISGASCKAGNCLDFDGVNDYVDLGNPAALQITGSQTIAMWVYPTDQSVRRNPYAKAYGGEGTITMEPSSTLNYYYGTSGGNTTPYQGFGNGGATIPLSQWTHITIVRDLTNMKLYWYKDGAQVSSGTANYASATASTLSAWIGKGYTSNFAGKIDNVRIYDGALTAQEVRALYDSGL